MPYDKNQDLPNRVKGSLPQHAQTIFRKAYNSAWEEYADPEDRRGDQSREQTANQIAWAAVKKQYHKDPDSGEWVKKDD